MEQLSSSSVNHQSAMSNGRSSLFVSDQHMYGTGAIAPHGVTAPPGMQAHSFSPFSSQSGDGYTSAFEEYQRQYSGDTLRRQQRIAQSIDSVMSGGQGHSSVFRPIVPQHRPQAATPFVSQQQAQEQMYPHLSQSPAAQQQGPIVQQNTASIVPSAPPQSRTPSLTPQPTQALYQQTQNRVTWAGTPYNCVYSPSQSMTQQNLAPSACVPPPGFGNIPQYTPQQVHNTPQYAHNAVYTAPCQAMPGATGASAPPPPPQPPQHVNRFTYPVVVQQQPSPQQGGYAYGYPPPTATQFCSAQLGPQWSPATALFPVSHASPASSGGISSTTDLLLYTTTAAQLKEFNGDLGTGKALDYFDNFEGLTEGWPDDKKLRLLRMKMSGTAKIALQNYLASYGPKSYNESKRQILETVSGMDHRPNEAWNELRNLQQKNGEALSQYGQRVLRLVRDAMGGHIDPTGLDRMCAKHFVAGIPDQQLRGFLAPLEDTVSFSRLISQAVNINSSLRISHSGDQRSTPQRSKQPEQPVPSSEHNADEQRQAFQNGSKKNTCFRAPENVNQAPLGNSGPMGSATGHFAPAGTRQQNSNSFVPSEGNANRRVTFAVEPSEARQSSSQDGRSAFGLSMGKPMETETQDENNDDIKNCSLEAFERLLTCDGDVVKWAQDQNVGGGHLLHYVPPKDTTGLPDVYKKSVLASIPPSEEPFVGKRSLIRVSVGGTDARALADTGANISVISTDFLLRLAATNEVNIFTLGFMNSEAKVLAADGKLCAILGSIILKVQYKDRPPEKVCFLVSKDKNFNDCVLGTNCLEQLGFVMFDKFEQKPLEFYAAPGKPHESIDAANLAQDNNGPRYSMMFVDAVEEHLITLKNGECRDSTATTSNDPLGMAARKPIAPLVFPEVDHVDSLSSPPTAVRDEATSSKTAAEMHIRSPPHAGENLEKAQIKHKRVYDARHKVHPNKHALGNRVMVFHQRTPASSRIPKPAWPYDGPYHIISLSPSSADIQPVDRQEMASEWVPVDRFCPCPSELGNKSTPTKHPRKHVERTPDPKNKPAVIQIRVPYERQRGPPGYSRGQGFDRWARARMSPASQPQSSGGSNSRDGEKRNDWRSVFSKDKQHRKRDRRRNE